MIKKYEKSLKSRKFHIFLIFLAAAFAASLVSKLSETYAKSTTFALVYRDSPDSLLLKNRNADEIEARVRASGFQHLVFLFKTREVSISLTELNKSSSRYYVTEQVYRRQIERQLPSSMILLEIEQDTLYFDFTSLLSKVVPVRSRIDIMPAQDYLMEGNVELSPDVVTVTGPRTEIDTLTHIATETRSWKDIEEDMQVNLSLVLPKSLENTTISSRQVQAKAKIFQFSEKILEVPVTVTNLPQGTEIRTFPNTITILCKAKVEDLRAIDVKDFKILADFGSVKANTNILNVRLDKIPESVYSVHLVDDQIEFILRRL